MGEYAALTFAGAIKQDDVFPIVQVRADAMQEAVPAGQGAMAALGASIAGTPGMVAGWGLGKAASSPRFQSELAFAMDAARKGYRASAPVRRWMKKAGIPAKYGAYFEARYGGLIGEMERSR